MSKICDKCGTTNFDSATICTRCGSLFKDGAYSLNNPRVNQTGFDQNRIKSAQSERLQIEKTTKVLIISIVAIVAILIAIIIIVVATGRKSDVANEENTSITADAGLTQMSGNPNSEQISGDNNLQPTDFGNAVFVDSITVNKTSVELKVGKTDVLTAEAKPDNAYDKSINWEGSSNTNVVSIENINGNTCTIKAKSAGTATVRVSASYVEDGKSVYQDITVTVVEPKKKPVQPTETDYYGEFDTTEKINLRTGPGVDYDSLLQIPQGETLVATAEEVDNDSNVWYYVKYNNKKGWVLGSYLVVHEDDPVEESGGEEADQYSDDSYINEDEGE